MTRLEITVALAAAHVASSNRTPGRLGALMEYGGQEEDGSPFYRVNTDFIRQIKVVAREIMKINGEVMD